MSRKIKRTYSAFIHIFKKSKKEYLSSKEIYEMYLKIYDYKKPIKKDTVYATVSRMAKEGIIEKIDSKYYTLKKEENNNEKIKKTTRI